MLCYVMLCYVMLCYVVLCYVMVWYVMLCYVMLCYVMLCITFQAYIDAFVCKTLHLHLLRLQWLHGLCYCNGA